MKRPITLSRLRPYLLIILVAFCLCIPASHAMAGVFTSADIDGCSGDSDPSHYTQKIVKCLQINILYAASYLLQTMSNYMTPVASAFFVLAIAGMGIRIAAGEPRVAAKTAGFAMRLGLVVFFSYNLGGFLGVIFDIEDELITMVVGGYSPWVAIDNFIGDFAGFAPGTTIQNGLIGLISASAYASTADWMITAAGGMAVAQALLFVAEVIYAYISSLIAICMLAIISPIFIPLGVLTQTESYLRKWINAMLSAMLFIVLLMACLAMLFNGFGYFLNNVFSTVGGSAGAANDFHKFYTIGQPAISSVLLPGDSNQNALQARTSAMGGAGAARLIPKVQSNIVPQMRTAMEMNGFYPAGVSIPIDVVRAFVFNLIALFLWGAIMMSLLGIVPRIAEEIAGGVTGLSFGGGGNLKARINKANSDIATGAGFMVGGRLGGQVGAAAFNKMGGQKWANTGWQLGQIGGSVAAIRSAGKLLP